MKRLALMIGIALSLGAPATAHAAGLSHYVQRVIARAEEGLSHAQGGDSVSGAADFLSDWIFTATSGIFTSAASWTSVTQQQQDLLRTSACLRGDQMVILLEMQKVQEAIRDASRPDQLKPGSIVLLNSLYVFLNERLAALNRGAKDPAYPDPTWNHRRLFDTDQTAQDARDERLCPFSTAYFDIGASGDYGCTPAEMDQTLQSLPDGPQSEKLKEAIQNERATLQSFIDELRKLRDAVPQQSSSGSFAYATTDAFAKTPAQEEGCMDDWSVNFRTRDTGAFWKTPGERFRTMIQLVEDLQPLRPVPEALRDPAPNILFEVVRQYILMQLSQFTKSQAQEDSVVLGGIADAKEVEDAFDPLKKTMGKLSRLAHNYDGGSGSSENAGATGDASGGKGIRDFVQDFAYFLRRSCMNRDCNARLERILKITPTDSCFPFTDGSGPAEGASSSEIQAAMDQCKQDAKLDDL